MFINAFRFGVATCLIHLGTVFAQTLTGAKGGDQHDADDEK
jgi:hypothetical protein